MVDGPTPRQWAELRARRPIGEDALATLAVTLEGDDTPLSVGMDQAGILHLLIPVRRGPVGALPSDLNGLRVRHRLLETGEVIELSAPPSHESVFTPFCREVADAVVVDCREPWAAVAATVRNWQSAWRPLRSAMDKTVQVGLFGELLVLRSLMIPVLGSAAVDQWSGPEFERHDFVGERLHLEVKTTRKNRPEHEISRLDQLQVPEGRQLLFVSVRLEQSTAGTATLATELDATINMLRTDAAALDAFMAKMVNVGWTDEMRNSGELLRFFVQGASIFPVDDDFPRFPDEFAPPPGVVSVRYTIDLANLPELDLDEAMALVRDANPEYVTA